jgi:hypothetical protein
MGIHAVDDDDDDDDQDSCSSFVSIVHDDRQRSLRTSEPVRWHIYDKIRAQLCNTFISRADSLRISNWL